MRGTAHGRHTALVCAPLSGTRPRALCLSDRTIRKAYSCPASACRRVVPWGVVSSWVKGAECTFSLTTYGRCCLKTTEIRPLSFRATATMATRAARWRGWGQATERKNSLSSPSWRIADHAAWMSLLLSRPSPVWVIAPRSVLSPVECSVGTKPSPFCFLDEVDAPLDDANLDRFNEMVKEMSGSSQFVLITHNKRTMQAAEVLYGITMEEPGVSKVVSVRMS